MVLPPGQARAIAASGYIFLLPLVANYRVMYREAIDPSSPAFGGGIGRWVHRRRTTSQESDVSVVHRTSLESSVWLDLRVGPWTFEQPQAGIARAAGVSDLWGFVEHDWTGDDGDPRPVMIARNEWVGTVPPGVGRIVRVETDFVRCTASIDMPDAGDVEEVRAVQRTYGVSPLGGSGSGTAAAAPTAPAHGWWPVGDEALTSLEFWPVATFALRLVTPDPEDHGVYDHLAEIGVVAGGRWDANALAPEVRDAIEEGMDSALTDLLRAARSPLRGELRLTRSDFDRDYFGRALAAIESHPLVGDAWSRTGG